MAGGRVPREAIDLHVDLRGAGRRDLPLLAVHVDHVLEVASEESLDDG
jgi:hypothetical protein